MNYTETFNAKTMRGNDVIMTEGMYFVQETFKTDMEKLKGSLIS